MKYREYSRLMKSVSEFARASGLNTDNLYAEDYVPHVHERFVISVSWKTSLDNSFILYSPKDEYRPDFDRSLMFPLVLGSKEQIDAYIRMAEEKGAEYFSKKVIATNKFIHPSPEFLALSIVEQAEYALHEAFHNTPKTVFGKKQDHLSHQYEEASALVIGYLGAIHYFKRTRLHQEAIAHWQKHLNLANLVNKFYDELEETLSFRIGKDKRPIPEEQKMEEREKILQQARKELGNQLGSPINNAFLIYWHHYYEKLGKMHEKCKDTHSFKETIKKMKTFNKWE